MRITDAVANSLLNHRTTLIDAGVAASGIDIRTGAPPAGISDAETGVLLASIDLANPSFGAAAARSMTANGLPLGGTGSATGVAGHYRVYDGNGLIVEDGVVGVDMILDNSNIAIGQSVNIVSWSKSYS